MSEENKALASERTIKTDADLPQAGDVPRDAMVSDTTPQPLPGDTVYTRPANPSPAAAIIDPDNREREALRAAASAMKNGGGQTNTGQTATVGANNFLARRLGGTPGERYFNLLDWFGIGYLVNSGVSIYLADKAKHSGWQPTFNRMYTWVGNKAAGTAFTPEDVMHADAFYDEVKQYAKQHAPDLVKSRDAFMEADKFMAGLNGHKEGLLKHLEQKSSGAMAHFGKNAEGLEAAFKRASETTIKMQKSRGWAAFVVDFFLLGTGGWLLMAPIKWLEDRKFNIVKAYDEKYQQKHSLNDAQRDALQKGHEKIQNEPQQSWSSVLTARAIAYPLIVGAYVATGSRKNILRPLGFEGAKVWAGRAMEATIGGLKGNRLTAGLTEKLERRLGVAPAGWKQAFAEGKHFEERNFQQVSGEQRLKSIVSDTYLEVIYSLVMAAMTFGWSRVTSLFFNGRGDEQAAMPHVSSPTVDLEARKNTPHAMEAVPPMALAPERPGERADTTGDIPQPTVTQHIHEGTAQKAQETLLEKRSAKADPMTSYRDLAAHSAVTSVEPARL